MFSDGDSSLSESFNILRKIFPLLTVICNDRRSGHLRLHDITAKKYMCQVLALKYLIEVEQAST